MTTFLEALQLLAEHESKRPECPMGTAEQDAAWAEEVALWEAEHHRLLALTGSSTATPFKPEAAPADARPIDEIPAVAGELVTSTEGPMPRIPDSTDPDERMDTLLVRLASQLTARNWKAACSTKLAIRKWCAKHGLAVPPEAMPRTGADRSESLPKAPRGPIARAKSPNAQVPPPQKLHVPSEPSMPLPKLDVPQVLREVRERRLLSQEQVETEASDRLARVGRALHGLELLVDLTAQGEHQLTNKALSEVADLLWIIGEFAQTPITPAGEGAA